MNKLIVEMMESSMFLLADDDETILFCAFLLVALPFITIVLMGFISNVEHYRRLVREDEERRKRR